MTRKKLSSSRVSLALALADIGLAFSMITTLALSIVAQRPKEAGIVPSEAPAIMVATQEIPVSPPQSLPIPAATPVASPESCDCKALRKEMAELERENLAAKAAAVDIASLEGTARDLLRRAEAAEEQLRALSEASQAVSSDKRGSLEPRSIAVVIAIDGSSSMEPTFDALRTQLEILAEAGAGVASEFHLGFVIFRNELDQFPLTLIEPSTGDTPGEGLRRLLSFAHDKTVTIRLHEARRGEFLGAFTGETRMQSRLSTWTTIVDPEAGIAAALQILERSRAERKLIVIAGDQGAGELGRQEVYEGSDKRSEQRAIALVRNFAERGGRVLALNTQSESQSPGFVKESEAFFKALGEHGVYRTAARQLTALVLAEAIRPGL